jgi:hypothetical protein
VHHGIEGLTIQWAARRLPQLPESFASEILTWIKARPASCGLDRANWIYAELVTSLYQTKGLTVSATTMCPFCTNHGVRQELAA